VTRAMQQRAKPLPIPNEDTKPFWEGCAREELRLQRCRACGAYRHPPSPRCPACLSGDAAWVAASGDGTVYSYVVVHQALDPAWEGDVPYVVAIIALAEGPHLLSNVVDTPVDRVAVGMPVKVCFERATEDVVLPKFRPAAT
jgi:uncharacterized OB-fold protein